VYVSLSTQLSVITYNTGTGYVFAVILLFSIFFVLILIFVLVDL